MRDIDKNERIKYQSSIADIRTALESRIKEANNVLSLLMTDSMSTESITLK